MNYVLLFNCQRFLTQNVGVMKALSGGELIFVDGSILHLREFVDVEITSDRLMYAYQYQDSSNKLIFRYDNTGHHKKLGLPTYPHHKQHGSEENVFPALAPDLQVILREIELLVKLP